MYAIILKYIKQRYYLSDSQKNELITDTGIPRDSQRFVFQFAWAATNHFFPKNQRNLRSRTMVATVVCRYFPSAKRRSQ